MSNIAAILSQPLFNQSNVDLIINTTSQRQRSQTARTVSRERVPVGQDRSVFWITHYRGFAAKLKATRICPFRICSTIIKLRWRQR